MSYTVQKLASLSGVSVRTLRYYDSIGLLKPAYYGANGYRYYEEEQLLQLQQILFFRELQFPLARIKRLLGLKGFDRVGVLRAHRAVLEAEVSRVEGLIETIDETIKHLKGEDVMAHDRFYEGFNTKKQAEYEQYLTDHYGDVARANIAESKRRIQDWTSADHERAKQEGESINRRILEALAEGSGCASHEVQTLISEHYRWISQFWTPTKETYSGLGRLYCDHPDFRKFFAAYDERFAEFLAEAMRIFAEQNL